MSTKPYHLHDAPGYLLTITARKIERRFETALKALDLTRISWCVLLAVGEESHRHPSDIADFIGIDRTAASRALRQMEAAGLIARDSGKDDRRTTRVRLTDKGADRLARAIPLARESRAVNESQLTAAELADLKRILEKLRGDDSAPLKKL